MPAALTFEALETMPEAAFLASVGDLFEHSPWVMQQAGRSRPFYSARALHNACMAEIRAAGADRQMALIRAHPELAGREAGAQALTADSAGEQGRLGFTALSPAEHEALAGLNAAYRERFGFPCIVALSRHGDRSSVMAAMRTRLAGTHAEEVEANLVEIGAITETRLAARLGRSKGGLSLHALDTVAGGGARGLAYALWWRAPTGWCVLTSGHTNAQGRTDRALLPPLDMEAGEYRIEYDVGAYHRAQGLVQTEVPFLGMVPIAFGIADTGVHYHVPLQFTPFSYATYRGS